MTHEEARRLSLARQVEPLSAGESDALTRHLAACAECGRYDRQVERGLQGFRSLSVRIDPDLVRRTQRRVAARMAHRSEPAWWLLAAAGALAASALLGWGALAGRLGGWLPRWLGGEPPFAVAWALFAWLLPAAAAALSMLLVGASAGQGRGGDPWVRGAIEIDDGGGF